MEVYPQQTEFESLVNTEGFQTVHVGEIRGRPFESLVNTEGFQTYRQ